jgi:hypothetical protein
VFVPGGVLGSYSAAVEVFNVLGGREEGEMYTLEEEIRASVRTHGEVNAITI